MWVFKRTPENITDSKKKKILLLTKQELKSHQDAKVCYILGKRISKKLSNSINCLKVRDNCHYTGKYRGLVNSVYNLRFNVPNEIPAIFHNGSNYDYHFVVNLWANEFDGQCLGGNSE